MWIVPFARAGLHEQQRYLFRIHVFMNCAVGWRAKRLKDQQHLIAFHELARLLDCLRRAVRIVIGDEVDLAAIDAAFRR
jgi:hypothetical protein